VELTARPAATDVSASPAMDAPFRSLLYREPRLYDLVFPDAEGTLASMCGEAVRRYAPGAPRSTLDIGCGTGRHLAALAGTVAERWGVDLLETNVAYARSAHPELHVVQGDMRAVRLGRTFDLVTSFGNALSYALTDGDLARTADTYAAHAHPGTLLIVDVLNAKSYLEGDGFRERIEGRVDAPGLQATSISTHALHREARILERTRVWHIPGRPAVEDCARYRLLDPEELAGLLTRAGFDEIRIFDNREFASSDLRGRARATPDPGGMGGRKLYAFARRRAGRP
jgi:SAM-dependent methyltransferase